MVDHRLLVTLDGNLAFVVDPLPPKITWTDALVAALSEAERAIGQLAGMGRRIPNPERLIRMFLRREAEFSSKIENTYARVQTIVLFDLMPESQDFGPEVREVSNNFKALEYAVFSAAHRPITRGLGIIESWSSVCGMSSSDVLISR